MESMRTFNQIHDINDKKKNDNLQLETNEQQFSSQSPRNMKRPFTNDS